MKLDHGARPEAFVAVPTERIAGRQNQGFLTRGVRLDFVLNETLGPVDRLRDVLGDPFPLQRKGPEFPQQLQLIPARLRGDLPAGAKGIKLLETEIGKSLDLFLVTERLQLPKGVAVFPVRREADLTLVSLVGDDGSMMSEERFNRFADRLSGR